MAKIQKALYFNIKLLTKFENAVSQIANGFSYLYSEDPKAPKQAEDIHDAKLDALREIVETNAGKQILVAFTFQRDLERILAAFPGAEQISDDDCISRWNAGKIPMLLAHPKSAGHGLNLQLGGASIVCWFGPTYSLEGYQQLNARLHRQGQKNAVIIHHIVAAGTIDEEIMACLRDKDVSQSRLLAAIKA